MNGNNSNSCGGTGCNRHNRNRFQRNPNKRWSSGSHSKSICGRIEKERLRNSFNEWEKPNHTMNSNVRLMKWLMTGSALKAYSSISNGTPPFPHRHEPPRSISMADHTKLIHRSGWSFGNCPFAGGTITGTPWSWWSSTWKTRPQDRLPVWPWITCNESLTGHWRWPTNRCWHVRSGMINGDRLWLN